MRKYILSGQFCFVFRGQLLKYKKKVAALRARKETNKINESVGKKNETTQKKK